MNSINFVGRLGTEPELKEVGSSQVLEFSMANDTGYGDKKVTNWYRISIWGKRATSLKRYLEKGKQAWICGELTLRKYTAKDGAEKISPEIKVSELEFIGGGNDSTSSEEEPF